MMTLSHSLSLRARWAIVLGAGLLMTGTAAAAPLALRGLDAFAVERVEVRGAHFLAPQTVLDASGIRAGATVFDELEAWRLQLLEHPLVASARFERRLPGTVIVHVVETRPVAFARTPELVPIDARARVLPIESARLAELDLPVLATLARPGSNGRFADRTTMTLAATLADIERVVPALLPTVSEIAPAPGGGIRVLLRGPTRAEALLPGAPDAAVLVRVQRTIERLAARDELDDVARIDARYSDQIVVSFGTDDAMKN
jgi:cell division protein FtsQ